MIALVNKVNPASKRGDCFECGSTNHYINAHPKLNRAPAQGGNRPNQPLAIEGNHNQDNNGNQTRRRAFVLGANEARLDPNIVMGTYSLNNYYATS